MNQTVAIVGSQSDTRHLAPSHDPDVDVWVMNEAANQWAKEWDLDAVFQIHIPVVYQSPHNRCDPHHWEWLQQDHGDLKIYMQEVDPDVPNSVRYPLEGICLELLGNFHQGVDLEECPFFRSTPVYAIALAIYQGYSQINVYGVEMSSDTEWEYQRDNLTFWTGIAIGRGIKVNFYSGDGIFRFPLYAYEGNLEQKLETFEERVRELKTEIRKAREKVERKADALLRAWNNKKLSERITEWAQAMTEWGNLEGALQVSERFHNIVSDMLEKWGTAFLDRGEWESALALTAQDANDYRNEVYRTAGELQPFIDMWIGDKSARAAALRAQIGHRIAEHGNACYAAGVANGVRTENTRWMELYDEQVRSAGGVKALEMVMGE